MKNFKLNHKTTLQFSFIAWVIFAATVFNSCICKPTEIEPADYRIKSTNDKERLFFFKLDPTGHFQYNADGKLYIVHPEGLAAGNLFTYAANSVEISGYKIIPLNAQGYRSKGESGQDLTYDIQGHLITESNFPGQPGTFRNFTWDTDGNLVKSTLTSTFITTNTTYTYTDIKDERQDGLDWYFGKRSRNLVKQSVGNGLGTSVTDYNYIFDTRGRVTLMTTTRGTAPTGSYTYTYFN